MFKLEINISDWGDDQTVTIETDDFDKIVAIQEFIDFQMDNDWNANWALINLEDEEDEEGDEDKEDEEESEVPIADEEN